MALSNKTEGMDAALNTSVERQKAILAQQQQELDALSLGQKLEGCTVALTVDIERVSTEVASKVFEVPEYRDLVDTIHNKQVELLKAFASWQKAQGSKAEPGIDKKVASLELAAIRLIETIKAKMGLQTLGIDPGALDSDILPEASNQGSEITSKIEQSNKSQVLVRPKNTNIYEFPTTQKSDIIPVNEPVTSLHEAAVSAYASQLSLATSRKTKSKAGSKASSKVSSAAKLQLNLDEAEMKVAAKFNAERDKRAQRILTRDIAKAKQKLIEEDKLRQRRLQEEEELRKQKLDDEKEEREAQIKMKEASIQARKQALDAHEKESQGKSSVAGGILSIAEIDPLDKVKAYMGGLIKHELEADLQADLKKNDFELPDNVDPATKLSTQKERDRKYEHPSVKGAYKDNEVKTEINSCAFKTERFPMPTYTTPVAGAHYTWTSQPQPALPTGWKNHPLTHKIEPLTYDQMGIEVTAEKLKFSTPLTQPGGLNPNSVPVFSPPLNQSAARSVPTHQTQGHPQLPAAADSDHKDRIIENVCGQMALSRLPMTEPEAFDGKDLMQFPLWRTTFEALLNRGAMTAVDKLNLLTRFVKGEAKLAIQGYLLMPPDIAFERAYRLLNDRYGDNFLIAGAFKNRLKTWPKLSGTDSTSLRSFVDFLRQCHAIKHSLPALRSLDDEAENAELVKKLPPWLARKWTRRVSTQRRATGEFPTFDEFVSFLEEEDLIVHDPLIRTLQKSEGAKERRTGASFASDSRPDYPNPGAGVGRSFGTCVYCGEKHSLQICRKFGSRAYEERQQYIRNHRLCFGCLVGGHIARNWQEQEELPDMSGGDIPPACI